MTFVVATSGTPTYSDINDIVEALVNTEGRRYPIPGYDHDDIAQEIRMECLRVLPYFDSGRIGHLRGKQIIDAEKYAFDKQDSAIFFGGENPVEIASNKIGKSECGMCEEGVCPV